MRLRFASLGSGSRGNALLVEFDGTLLMVDCGLPRRDIESRLSAIGVAASDIAALLITHEHADHIRSVEPFVRRYGTPVWMTPGTASRLRGLTRINALSCQRAQRFGGIDVQPYLVPHDAREPCQFVFSAGGRRLGLLTDAGQITMHIRERLAGCDALALEFNHDVDALEQGNYPASVKARIGSNYGHLNNAQASSFLEQFGHSGLQWVMAMHISEQNNSCEHVRRAVAQLRLPANLPLHLAAQHEVSGWVSIE
jgi:phosphoribosyl 1,2-cyclic phosphodiesterase